MMNNLEKKLDALIRLVTAEDSSTRNELKMELATLMQEPKKALGLTELIEDMLTRLGMSNAILGFRYSTEAIRLVVLDESYVHNITKGLYPAVAKACGTTPSRAERAIRHAVEIIFDRCDTSTLEEVFGNSVSPTRGKLTNAEFVARMAIVIRRQVGDVA